MLRCLGSFTICCQREITLNIIKNQGNKRSKYNAIIIDNLLIKFINNMSQIVTQLVVVVRNLSLDSNGRNQLQNTKIIGILCSLLKPYKKFPELCLNCVRVTAKLSLQDNFRAQINA